MSAVTLQRTDKSRNIHRFYLLAVQPELFGRWSLVREWERIGQPGQVRIVSYATHEEAEAAFTRYRRRKSGGGYRQDRSGSWTESAECGSYRIACS